MHNLTNLSVLWVEPRLLLLGFRSGEGIFLKISLLPTAENCRCAVERYRAKLHRLPRGILFPES